MIERCRRFFTNPIEQCAKTSHSKGRCLRRSEILRIRSSALSESDSPPRAVEEGMIEEATRDPLL